MTRLARKRPGHRQIDFDSSWGVFALAVGGAALAGGAYPLLLAIVKLSTGTGLGGSPDGAELACFALTGGIAGFCLALVVATHLAVFVGLVGWICGIAPKSIWFASLIGGWTGFLASQLMLDIFRMGNVLILVGVATATGQVGSAWAVWFDQRPRKIRITPANARDSRIGLRQMFGITTAIAVLAALGSSIEISTPVYSTLWLAIAIQATNIALWSFYSSRRRESQQSPSNAAMQAPPDDEVHG